MTTRKLLTLDLTVIVYEALDAEAERAGVRPEVLAARAVAEWLAFRRGEAVTEVGR